MSPEWGRLLGFAALALFTSLNWAGMVSAPPLGRAALSVLPPVLAVALLLPLRRSRLRGWAVNLVAAAALVAAAGLAMVIVGMPPRLLAPGGWSELWSGIDLGLAGLGGGVDYPYSGPSDWSRLVILICAPAVVGLAALVSFMPFRRDPAAPRLAGLAVLVVAYAVAAANREPDHVVLVGIALLLAVVAWVWLPVIKRPALLGGAALVAVAIAAAVPFTARLGDEAALVRYSAWSWAEGPGTAFEWEHSYGPIDWDRSEDTVMLVESDQPNYWKASVLDRFDGRTWERSDLVRPSVELPTDVEADVVPSELEAEWFTEVSVSISGLRSDLAVGPGSSRSVVSGIDATPSSDGSLVRTLVEPLSKGDVYKTRGYAPDPTAEQMRGAGWSVPRALAPMTEIDLPEAAGGPNDRVRTLGLSEGRAEDARRAIAASPYRRMAQLADRLTAGAPSAYDAVKAIEAHLLANYSYSETPPDRPLPLESFLFEDRVGYCQQFSGAMAVMLRMAGIPARVATGFSPGIHEGGDRFRVRVLDAHSWVEVYFAGIGWVPFDPTPAVAPAELRTGGTSAASSAASSLGPLLYGARGFFGDGDGGGPGPRGGGGRPLPTPPPPESSPSTVSGLWLIVAMLVAAAAAVGPGLWRRLRERGATRDELVEARVRELERALRRLRFRHQPDATLLDVEHSLRSRAEPLAARYVQRLRRLRYGREPLDGLPPGGERRALRRRLRVRGGLTARLASYRAIPPLSPRR